MASRRLIYVDGGIPKTPVNYRISRQMCLSQKKLEEFYELYEEDAEHESD